MFDAVVVDVRVAFFDFQKGRAASCYGFERLVGIRTN
jgi:hypothetical protein